MSDDGSGSTENVKSVHPRRSLFQVNNALRPPPSHERQSIPGSLSYELRHRDGHSQSIHPESFVVDIPLYDEYGQIDVSTPCSNQSTYAVSTTYDNNSSYAGSRSPSVSSSESQSICSRDGEYDSTNNSSAYKDTSDVATSSKDSSDEDVPIVQENTDCISTGSSSNAGFESELTLDSNENSVSDSTSCEDSSGETVNYEQYRCQTNRNINAKKRKKSKSDTSDKEPLVDEDEKEKGGKRRKRKKSKSAEGESEGGKSSEGGESGEDSDDKGGKRRRSKSGRKKTKSEGGESEDPDGKQGKSRKRSKSGGGSKRRKSKSGGKKGKKGKGKGKRKGKGKGKGKDGKKKKEKGEYFCLIRWNHNNSL